MDVVPLDELRAAAGQCHGRLALLGRLDEQDADVADEVLEVQRKLDMAAVVKLALLLDGKARVEAGRFDARGGLVGDTNALADLLHDGFEVRELICA